ncbi:histidine kinase [Streptomyces sp. MP131-18]|uniref:sensor histidine kinase n=1 Tax=Streptomyces sp. MP131-18 TaxID=1857892 RepID=UPI00097C7461|nr:histidine kinase [Streptomyces sp. MP131-18]
MPYFLLTAVALGVAFRVDATNGPGWQFLAFALSLPLVAATGLLAPVRLLEAGAARTLAGVPGAALAAAPAGSWAARRRAAAWFTAHLGLGGLVSGATLAVPPLACVLLAAPFSAALRGSRFGAQLPLPGDAPWLGPPAGLALLAALTAAAAGAGALLVRLAPALLGPTPADRLAAAEARAADLAARNRLARELHDSVGHALSAVTLQAAAAGKVLDADPEFAREALAAIEDTARGAVAELDTVLGLLREDEAAGTAPAPTLADLDGLLSRTRAAGVTVVLPRGGPPGGLPRLVSREAYRIVQEGLANALRHAGAVRVALCLTADEEELTLTMENPLTAGRDDAARGGGRGLRGIEERAALLGGSARWGAHEGTWRLEVRLPLGAAR